LFVVPLFNKFQALTYHRINTDFSHLSPDTSDLDLAATSSQGKTKLTKAMSRRGGTSKALKKSKSFQKNEELLSIGGRDTSLFLFRALGKILYCKRKWLHVRSELYTVSIIL